ncbi:hypothetical protein [Bifidobacterium scardovii]|uniref:hypothetical protein n=1 Tax=Bifidobacterium scardovii TaxID=158787 RepID=UPI00052966CE|nr:hypothetical protein [Bifidobacterium scardovii]MDK6348700.1 hypothetical protein [Bifidobacterium scardovii]MDU8981322.1 hypothetical protein [Bifidobacterium scardovii]
MRDMDEIRSLMVEVDVALASLRRALGDESDEWRGGASPDVAPAVVGENLMRLRNPVCSQTQLALMMRSDGFAWSPATVWAIESGRRRLRFDEAVRVVVDLGYGVAALFELFGPSGDCGEAR